MLFVISRIHISRSVKQNDLLFCDTSYDGHFTNIVGQNKPSTSFYYNNCYGNLLHFHLKTFIIIKSWLHYGQNLIALLIIALFLLKTFPRNH